MRTHKHVPKWLVGFYVLLVDDEHDNIAVAQILLEMAGAVVGTASNGQEALESIHAYSPDLIITDLTMPVMDGWALLECLRASNQRRSIPCFALTAHAMSGDQDRVIAAGFDGYVSKPLDPQIFVQRLVHQMCALPQFSERLELICGGEMNSDGEAPAALGR